MGKNDYNEMNPNVAEKKREGKQVTVRIKVRNPAMTGQMDNAPHKGLCYGAIRHMWWLNDILELLNILKYYPYPQYLLNIYQNIFLFLLECLLRE